MKAVITRPDWPELYQTDPRLLVIPKMRPQGCYFMTWVRALSVQYNVPLDISGVIDFFRIEILDSTRDVTNEMFVEDPQNLFDDFIGVRRVEFLGVRPADYVCEEDELEACRWHLDPHSYSHFVQGDGHGVTIFDPWSAEGSESARSPGKLMDKRIAKILR